MDSFNRPTSPTSDDPILGSRRLFDHVPCTHGRVLSAERLDSAQGPEVEKNLRDIARINRWFGGHRTLIRLLRQLVGPEDRFSLLDVGAASGDMGRCIQQRFRHATVVSLDRRLFHLKTFTTPRVAADAFALPFRDASFDLVLCSSLLHQFSNTQVAAVLLGLRRIARRGVIILDIERYLLAYCFLPLTRPFLRWSALTVQDGCASVEAAFRCSELESLVRSLVPSKVVARRHRPWFRFSMVIAAGTEHKGGAAGGLDRRA